MAKEIIKTKNNLQSLLGEETKILTQQELNRMKKGDLDKYTKEVAKKIVEKIHSISQDIQEAQDLNDQASTMEIKGDLKNKLSFGFIGKSKTDKLNDKQNLSNKAQAKQSKAILHMNELIQESIKFTCCSMVFANRMVEYLSHFVLKGFKDKDGYLINLNNKATEMVEHMMSSIQKGIDREMRVDKKMASIGERLDAKDKLDEQQNKDIEDLQKKVESKKLKIDQIEKELDAKDELDEQQSRDIEDLQKKVENKKLKIAQIKKELDEKDILDDRQDKAINALNDRILKLEGDKRLSIISFALATLSTILSIVAIALILVSKQLIF